MHCHWSLVFLLTQQLLDIYLTLLDQRWPHRNPAMFMPPSYTTGSHAVRGISMRWKKNVMRSQKRFQTAWAYSRAGQGARVHGTGKAGRQTARRRIRVACFCYTTVIKLHSPQSFTGMQVMHLHWNTAVPTLCHASNTFARVHYNRHFKSLQWDLNSRPLVYKTSALTPELWRQVTTIGCHRIISLSVFINSHKTTLS